MFIYLSKNSENQEKQTKNIVYTNKNNRKRRNRKNALSSKNMIVDGNKYNQTKVVVLVGNSKLLPTNDYYCI